jgi:hypothetical protein
LSAGNTTDFDANSFVFNTTSAWNVSGDASCTFGDSPATGFLTTDFEDYLNGDLRIKAASAGTTVAKFPGFPVFREDCYGSIRPRNGVFYAGAHDPAAGYIPAVGEVKRSLVYGLDNERTGEGVTTHPDIRG